MAYIFILFNRLFSSLKVIFQGHFLNPFFCFLFHFFKFIDQLRDTDRQLRRTGRDLERDRREIERDEKKLVTNVIRFFSWSYCHYISIITFNSGTGD